MTEDELTSEKPPSRESGFLLIADMVNSTGALEDLPSDRWRDAVARHNEIVRSSCTEQGGQIIGQVGDSVVAKFPVNDAQHIGGDLVRCLLAAKSSIAKFEELGPLAGDFELQTKVLLQYFSGYSYSWSDGNAGQPYEVIGEDITLAFRLSDLSWRLQVLVTGAFMVEFLRHCGADECRLDDLLDEARETRLKKADSVDEPGDLSKDWTFPVPDNPAIGDAEVPDLRVWLTDARRVTRLNGMTNPASVFLLSFTSPDDDESREECQRRSIKIRQDSHAVVMVNARLRDTGTDEYIRNVLDVLDGKSGEFNKHLDSEITGCVAASLLGNFDFMFRISCSGDKALKKFVDVIHQPTYEIQELDVRQTIQGRFSVNRSFGRILARMRPTLDSPITLVLAWFEADERRGYDLFTFFHELMRTDENGLESDLHILEAGEVIHSTPYYAVMLCSNQGAYSQFFTDTGINATRATSYVVQLRHPNDLALRYGLVNGVYLPDRLLDVDPTLMHTVLKEYVETREVTCSDSNDPVVCQNSIDRKSC